MFSITKNKSMNKLIILIPHCNSVNALLKTVGSISESFPVDILIVDDGSIEKPVLENLNTVYKNPGKIILDFLPQNQGIEKALNHGLKLIEKWNYKYIGRLDSGDFAIADKFQKQITYLDQNADVYLLGTWGNIVDENLNHLYFLEHPATYEKIQKKMYFNSCFIHPSVVFRKEILQTVGYYPENRKSAEDYAFFFQIMKKHKVENLPEVLLNYVVSENSISTLKRKEQIKNRIKIIQDHFYFGIYPILGLLRNVLLLYTSRNLVIKLKKIFRI